MNKRFAVSALAAVLGAASLVGPLPRAQADGLTMPPPPAYGVAQRLESIARTTTDAGLARRRAVQAIRKYNDVVSSATYRKTPFAPESMYHQALLQKDFIKDEYGVGDLANAVQTLKTLHNNYADIDYPDKAAALTALTETEHALDRENQTVRPNFMGTLGPALYKLMDFFVRIFGGAGSYAYFLAILAISVLVRLLMTPLSNKQYASMKEMQKIQPYVKELQAKYKSDPQVMMRKQQELYKEHGVNMFGGCLPSLAQLPFFILLYQMIVRYQYHFSGGHFLWIGSPLSHTFPAYLGTSLAQLDIPLLVLYGLSMFVQSKMMATPSADPQQAEQQRMMSIMMPFMGTYFFYVYKLPSAFVLYYLISNLLMMGQQYYYMKKRGLGAHGEGDTGGGDGGSRVSGPDVPLNGGNGSAKARPSGTNGNGNGTRKVAVGRDLPLVEAKTGTTVNGSARNGATPAARGVIAPTKVHPKKKRR